jgi:phosphohistidine phosphatase
MPSSRLMLIGHHPGVQQLALKLARQSPATDDLAAKYPTATPTTLQFTAPTRRELDPESGELVDVVRPRDLAWA